MTIPISDEVNCPQDDIENAGQGLLQRAFARENLQQACKRVKDNKGAAGIDGLDIEQTAEHLLTEWAGTRQQLLSGGVSAQSGTSSGHPQT
nr:RNA-directed DNA polymerase (Reverse transcriptase) [Pseudomonas gingeri]